MPRTHGNGQIEQSLAAMQHAQTHMLQALANLDQHQTALLARISDLDAESSRRFRRIASRSVLRVWKQFWPSIARSWSRCRKGSQPFQKRSSDNSVFNRRSRRPKSRHGWLESLICYYQLRTPIHTLINARTRMSHHLILSRSLS